MLTLPYLYSKYLSNEIKFIHAFLHCVIDKVSFMWLEARIQSFGNTSL